MITKICTKCGKEKYLEDFFIRSDNGRHRNECKECSAKFQKRYRKDNKERIRKSQKKYILNHKKQRSETAKKYYNKNKDKIKQYHKQYHEEHRVQKKEYAKNYYYEHKKEYQQRKKHKLANDTMFKIKEQARKCVWTAFNRKSFRKNGKTEQILGCDFNTFYYYLLRTYKDNYGYEYDFKQEVHIDHIKPLKNAKTEEEVIKLCHYTNLQLLKAHDNLEKSDKLNWKLKKEE